MTDVDSGKKKNIKNRLAVCRDTMQVNPKISLGELALACYGRNYTRLDYQKTAALRCLVRQQLQHD